MSIAVSNYTNPSRPIGSLFGDPGLYRDVLISWVFIGSHFMSLFSQFGLQIASNDSIYCLTRKFKIYKIYWFPWNSGWSPEIWKIVLEKSWFCKKKSSSFTFQGKSWIQNLLLQALINTFCSLFYVTHFFSSHFINFSYE